MAHDNRSRIIVDTAGQWQRYTQIIPQGMTVIGTVTRGGDDSGALAQVNATGLYVQVNNGVVRTVDGRKIAAALGSFGRPTEMSGGKRVNVYLDATSLEHAAKIGNGNVSEGIRLALQKI